MTENHSLNAADYRWYLEHDLSAYAGQWVAIRDEAVVAAAPTFGGVAGKLAKTGIKNVLFARIPEKMELVYAAISV